MAWRSGGGDLADARDMSVANMLGTVLKRADDQKKEMDKVSQMINDLQTDFLTSNQRKEVLWLVANTLDEKMMQTAILITSGDRMAMMYLIRKGNLLTNQLLRPAPRVLRTKQLFNEFRQAWRYAIGLHMSRWEEILQNNSVAIIKDIPIIRGSANAAKQGLVDRVRTALQTGNDLDKT